MSILLHAMNVRLYQPEDNSALAQLFAETVRTINSADYSPEQVEAWVGVTLKHIAHWYGPLVGLMVFVAEHESEIVGFTALEPNGHLVYLYVHHLFQRRRVASALIRRIEEELASLGVHRIFTEASITARPFFERMGFRVLGSQNFRAGDTSCFFYLMEKFLAQPS